MQVVLGYTAQGFIVQLLTRNLLLYRDANECTEINFSVSQL